MGVLVVGKEGGCLGRWLVVLVVGRSAVGAPWAFLPPAARNVGVFVRAARKVGVLVRCWQTTPRTSHPRSLSALGSPLFGIAPGIPSTRTYSPSDGKNKLATRSDPLDDGLRDFLWGVLRRFETFGLTEEEVFCVPGGAAVRWTGSGRGRNGRDVTFRGIDVFAVDGEGRITSLDAYWDAAPVMEAISNTA